MDRSNPLARENTFWLLIASPEDNRLCLPPIFQKQCKGNVPSKALLITGDGYPSVVEMISEDGVVYITTGWQAFRGHYGIGMCSMILFSFDDPKKIDVALYNSDYSAHPVNRGPYDFEAHIQQHKIALQPSGLKTVLGKKCKSELSSPDDEGNIGEEKSTFNEGHTEDAPESGNTYNEEDVSMPSVRADSNGTIRTKRMFVSFTEGTSEGKLHSPAEFGVDYLNFKYTQEDEPTLGSDKVLIEFPTNGATPGEYHLNIPFKAVLGPYYDMELPMDLANHMLKIGRNHICFVVEGEGIWPIICRLDQTSCIIEDGWVSFARDNELRGGDRLVFYRGGTQESCWNVRTRSHWSYFY